MTQRQTQTLSPRALDLVWMSTQNVYTLDVAHTRYRRHYTLDVATGVTIEGLLTRCGVGVTIDCPHTRRCTHSIWLPVSR